MSRSQTVDSSVGIQESISRLKPSSGSPQGRRSQPERSIDVDLLYRTEDQRPESETENEPERAPFEHFIREDYQRRLSDFFGEDLSGIEPSVVPPIVLLDQWYQHSEQAPHWGRDFESADILYQDWLKLLIRSRGRNVPSPNAYGKVGANPKEDFRSFMKLTAIAGAVLLSSLIIMLDQSLISGSFYIIAATLILIFTIGSIWTWFKLGHH